MQFDFDETPPVRNFVNIPEGTYLCRVAEVQPGTTRSGDERWGLRLVVAEGEFVGRQAAWDGLAFSERGLVRTQRVFAALGLPAEGRVTVNPEDLVGREAFVTVKKDEYHDPGTGTTIVRLKVPYEGYRAAPAAEQAAPPSGEGSDAIPF